MAGRVTGVRISHATPPVGNFTGGGENPPAQTDTNRSLLTGYKLTILVTSGLIIYNSFRTPFYLSFWGVGGWRGGCTPQLAES